MTGQNLRTPGSYSGGGGGGGCFFFFGGGVIVLALFFKSKFRKAINKPFDSW